MKKDKKICLICNKFFVKPMTHCWQAHGIYAREYKEMFGLDVSKGIIPHTHKELLRKNALKNGMGERLEKSGESTRFKKGHKINYKRSKQTLDRLKNHIKQLPKPKKKKIISKIKTYCFECKKSIFIYPRAYQKNNNFCGVVCRNRSINKKRFPRNLVLLGCF